MIRVRTREVAEPLGLTVYDATVGIGVGVGVGVVGISISIRIRFCGWCEFVVLAAACSKKA